MIANEPAEIKIVIFQSVSERVSERHYAKLTNIVQFRHNFHFLPNFNSKTTERFSPIFPRCRAISGAIDARIRMTIVHSVSKNARVLNEGHFTNFAQNWLP